MCGVLREQEANGSPSRETLRQLSLDTASKCHVQGWDLWYHVAPFLTKYHSYADRFTDTDSEGDEAESAPATPTTESVQPYSDGPRPGSTMTSLGDQATVATPRTDDAVASTSMLSHIAPARSRSDGDLDVPDLDNAGAPSEPVPVESQDL
jgi:hypothetical protein